MPPRFALVASTVPAGHRSAHPERTAANRGAHFEFRRSASVIAAAAMSSLAM